MAINRSVMSSLFRLVLLIVLLTLDIHFTANGESLLSLALAEQISTVSLVSSPSDKSTPDRPITLEQAIRIGTTQNRQLKMQNLAVQLAKTELMSARGLFLPTLDYHYNYTRIDAETLDSMNFADDLPFEIEGYIPFYNPAYEQSLSAFIPLYLGGVNWSILATARWNYHRTLALQQSLRLAVIAKVEQTYLEVRRAKHRLSLARRFLESAKAAQRSMEDQFKEGRATRSGRLQRAADVASRELEVAQMERNYSLARRNFRRALGVSWEPHPSAVDFSRFEKELRQLRLLTNETLRPLTQDCIQQALRQNFELQSLRYEQKMNETKKGEARAAFLPTLTVSGQYSWGPEGDEWPNERNQWQVLASLGVSLFKGFRDRAAYSKAKILTTFAGEKYKDRAEELTIQVEQLVSDYQNAAHSIAVAEKAHEVALESLSVARNTFTQGRITATDLLNIELAERAAAINVIEAKFAFMQVRTSLFITLGHAGWSLPAVIEKRLTAITHSVAFKEAKDE